MSDESPGYAVPVCPNDVFDAISHQRRRRVIMSLARAHEPVPAGDLAVELAAIEGKIDPSTVSGEDRTRVYVSLIQTHLPRLADLGIANYDDQSKRVTPTDATQPVASFVQELETACYQSGDRER